MADAMVTRSTLKNLNEKADTRDIYFPLRKMYNCVFHIHRISDEMICRSFFTKKYR